MNVKLIIIIIKIILGKSSYWLMLFIIIIIIIFFYEKLLLKQIQDIKILFERVYKVYKYMIVFVLLILFFSWLRNENDQIKLILFIYSKYI